MKQINLKVSREFLGTLKRFMKFRGISNQSEAIRTAVSEAVEVLSQKHQTNYRGWLGMGLKKAPSSKRKFKDEDALWEK